MNLRFLGVSFGSVGILGDLKNGLIQGNLLLLIVKLKLDVLSLFFDELLQILVNDIK